LAITKRIYFDGDQGEQLRYEPIPDELIELAETKREEMRKEQRKERDARRWEGDESQSELLEGETGG